jgi:hypothetical protein
MIPSLAHEMNFDKGQADAGQRGLAFDFFGVCHLRQRKARQRTGQERRGQNNSIATWSGRAMNCS